MEWKRHLYEALSHARQYLTPRALGSADPREPQDMTCMDLNVSVHVAFSIKSTF